MGFSYSDSRGMVLKTIDLFAGIGGFHLAFHNLGVETVFASEWNKHARLTYETNLKPLTPGLFETGMFAEDITKVSPESIPDFDVLCGGFPCQPFSNAGKRAGFEDTRGTLFFNVANILKIKQPKAFFLENVRGLLSHNSGETFKVIQNTLDELGYTLYWKVVRGNDFNVPQARPRLFMVGFRKDLNDSFVWPEPVELTNTLNSVLGGEVTQVNGKPRTVGFTLRVGGRGSGVHDRRNWDSYIVDGAETRLTVDQGKMLQGFPEDYVFPVSEAQAFKQLGNSVVVPAIQAVAEQILKVLNK